MEKEKAKPVLAPGRRQLAEQVRVQHVATAEAGVTFEQMLDPDFWAHEARSLSPYDLIECRSDDGSFWGLVIVLETGRNWAKVHPLQYVPLDTKDVAQTRAERKETGAYRIEYKGATMKHVVIRNSDNAVVHQGEQRKAGAEAWLRDHEQALAR